jgi:molybdopterin converting factor small subunit
VTSMKVHVQVFSYLREYLPPNSNERGQLALDLPDQATLQDLFVALGIAAHLGEKIFTSEVNNTFQVLVNNATVHDYSQMLSDNDTIIMFPPMAGGQSRPASKGRSPYDAG